MNRAMPVHLDAERAVLGSVLLERDAIIPAAELLQSNDFYLDKHRWVYEAMLACLHRRVPPDLQTIAAELRKHDQLVAVGDIPFLVELSNGVPTPYHVEYYAQIVAHMAGLRRLIDTGGKIAALGFQQERELADVYGDAQQLLTSALAQRDHNEVVPLATALDEVYALLQQGLAPGVTTGFSDYDRLTGGFHPADLLILAARPRQGKTALALALTRNLIERDQRVLFFSLEMSRVELAQRLLAQVSGVPLEAVRLNHMDDDQLQLVIDAQGRCNDRPLHIDHTGAIRLQDLRLRALRHAQRYGTPALLVVDYLQLVTPPYAKEANREQQVASVSRGLKALAKELGTTVLALSQLNRAVEQRTSHIPTLADLRESGSIEQEADQVIFIHREELYDAKTDKKGIAELYVAKHRNGQEGVVPLHFDGARMRFASLDRYHT